MSTSEEMRLQGAPDSSATADAFAEREQRLGHDEAQLAAGAHPGHDQQTVHFGGQPSPATQMQTHVPAPFTPDEGGHQSAADRIG